MTIINTRLTVSPDGTITSAIPLPPGAHTLHITLPDHPAADLAAPDDPDLPVHNLKPWPEGLSPRREDPPGENGP